MTRMFALECVARATLALINHEPENALYWLRKVVEGMDKVKRSHFGFNGKTWA